MQLLRFVAALLVVVAHATQTYSLRLAGGSGSDYWHFGTIGVDIFFVISGFVMASTSMRLRTGLAGARTFLLRRVVRVVPIYWLVTALKILIVLAVPAASLKSIPTIEHVLCSFLFIPHKTLAGEFWPVLPVGWTLNFEMFFYLVFAGVMLFTRYRFLGVAATFGLILTSELFAPSWDVLEFFRDSLLLEFLFGMAIAHVARSERWAKLVRQQSFLCATGLTLLMVLALSVEGHLPRGLTWGIAAACAVAMMLIFEEFVRRSRALAPAVTAGDSSYSLYLVHTFTVPGSIVLMGKLGVAWEPLAVSVAAIASVLAAELTFRAIERPVLRALSRRILGN